MPDPATLFDPFPERVRAFSELVKAVGESRLKAAQADLNEAVAANEWVRAHLMETVLEQLQTDLDSLDRTAASAARKVDLLARRAHAASMLLRGTEIAAYPQARDAYKFFEKQALIEGDQSLFDLTFSPSTIKGPEFLNNRDPRATCEDPPADQPEMNALQLMAWALEKQYIARTGTKAQQHFVRIFKQISQVAQSTLSAIKETQDAVRKQVFDVWQPVRIIGAEPSPAEKRILESSGPKPAS
ncbi:MAG: hypothetical protein NVSMB9_32090 [Isosphaeraceae bacterium]